jgi:hypothetical protein
MSDTLNWLDTETRGVLGNGGDPKLAPPKSGEFALVLIKKGAERQRLWRAIHRIKNCKEAEARRLVLSHPPLIIDRGLTLEEALQGQFELICCDSVSAFFRSEVILGQDENYLAELYRKVLASPEFRPVRVDVLEVPETESGQRFVDQFLGPPLPGQKRRVKRFSSIAPFKKARIMTHWGARIGAPVQCLGVDMTGDGDL